MISLLGLLLAGCGTCSNLEGKPDAFWSGPPNSVPSPFGGVGNDCIAIADFFEREDLWIWLLIPPLVCDLPFSLVGDAVTLPRVLAMRQELEQAKQTGRWPDWAWPHLQAEAVSASRIPAELSEAEARPPQVPNH